MHKIPKAGICLVLTVLASIALQPAQYTVYGQDLSTSNGLNVGSILVEAHQLANQYGIRPYWQKTPYSKGEIPPPSEVPDIIAHLIPCENMSRLLHPSSTPKIIDSNNHYSYGDLMFQSSTWAGVERGAGFTGSPLITADAINGAEWAIEHGYLYWWSCARILKILK
jgi:hypothetical protein